MASVVVVDHILRDILTGERTSDLGGLAPEGVATTGLRFFRLCSSLARSDVVGKLSAPVAGLPARVQVRFRAQITALPDEIEMLPIRGLAWPMALLQHRHGSRGRGLSTAMVEALAAAHRLDAGIAVSTRDVGLNLRDSALDDGIESHAL